MTFRFPIVWLLALALLVLLGFDLRAFAQTGLAEKPSTGEKTAISRPPKGLTTYMGRRIALPMSYHGIPWLNRPERVDEEKPSEMLEQLQLRDGMVVCDMGSGDGYYTFQMATQVAPAGRVLAVDIQPEMLQALSRKMEDRKVRNIDTILPRELL